MKRLNLPNSITIIRMLLTVPISAFLIKDKYLISVFLFAVAAISDVADGFLARILNEKTKLGAILDPLADKILINYTFVILATKGLIPVLLFITILFKDIILVAGSTIEVLSVKTLDEINIKASLAGKLSTFLQVVVIVMVFFRLFSVYKNETAFGIAVYSAILTSILALFSYINSYLKLIKEA